MDTTNLNSEIKRLFFQLLETGNKYVKHVYSGSISYNVKVEDEYYCHSIHFFKSSVGALGLMQMMPDTFSWLTNDRLGDRFSVGMLYDPETNIKYGVYYLSWLYDRYADWDITLAAYNAGPENVDKWLEDPTVSDLETGKLINIPFKETREYVKKVNKALGKYESLYDKK